eukprot:746230-Hanusia_phi.AAC.10
MNWLRRHGERRAGGGWREEHDEEWMGSWREERRWRKRGVEQEEDGKVEKQDGHEENAKEQEAEGLTFFPSSDVPSSPDFLQRLSHDPGGEDEEREGRSQGRQEGGE